MINDGDTVITGLSGGADSVCLLLCLRELSSRMNFSLRAVHVNHSMRGKESDRDQTFCEELCEKLNIPIDVFRVDVYAHMDKSGKSPEEAARELRYGAFENAAKGHTAVKIATAHNKGDNTETVLFNIARGTGTKGICGIPYVRQLGDISVIRPLLGATRGEIEAFLGERQQSYVTDSTNLTEDYTRNKLRARVLPVLKEINPAVDTAVERLSGSTAEDEAFFAEYISSIPHSDICRCHGAVRKRYIRKLLSDNNIECSYERINTLDCMMTGGKDTRCCLSGDVFAVFRKGIMTIEKMSACDHQHFEQPIDLRCDTEINAAVFDKRVIISGAVDDIFYKDGIVNKKLTKNCLNCAKIQGDAVLRTKHDGDNIRFAGKNFSTKLKKLYNEMKLTPAERAAALVIEDEGGIIWSEYGGVSERVCVQKGDSISDIYEVRATLLTDPDNAV